MNSDNKSSKTNIDSNDDVIIRRKRQNAERVRAFRQRKKAMAEYGLINKEYCGSEKRKHLADIVLNGDCNCNEYDSKELCAIKRDGEGFRIRWFENKCQLIEHNCKNKIKYNKTDDYICKQSIGEIDKSRNDINKNITNIVVVNSRMFHEDDINDTIDKFFAASHIFDLPIKEMGSRRMWVKNAGPVKVFVPWIEVPKNKSHDKWHMPTLSSCYHKCPTTCPATYAPVCGVPGIVAREPSLMFQNHCFMDVAQCKMFWEGKSSTSHSSSYVETSFLFCMGDEMNAVYRFLPAVRTLQKMGRLKKKGKFRQKLRNFRFINNFRFGAPKFMG